MVLIYYFLRNLQEEITKNILLLKILCLVLLQVPKCSQFLGWLKQLGPAQTILGTVKRQGTKGQISSTGLFDVLEFSQKTNEFVIVVKTNSFVCFLGEFEDTKSPFETI